MTNNEFYDADHTPRRQVRYKGQIVEIAGRDLRGVGCPDWLARKVEKRQAETALQELFRQQAKRRLEAAMLDPDAQRRAKADMLGEEIDADEIGELSEDERNLIRTLRQLKLKSVS